MSSGDMFDHYIVAATPSSRKKDSKRVRGESSKAASKKAQTDGPSAAAPSKETTPPPTKETTPPPSPLDQPSPTAPVDQHSTPPVPTDQPHHTQPEDTLTSTVGLLTITAGWRRTGTLVTQIKDFDTRHTKAVKVLKGKNSELLKKNAKLTNQNNELREQKAQLTEELLECRAALTKSKEDKEKFTESAKLNYQEGEQLELDLIASRKEMEGRVKELEETNAKNFEKNKKQIYSTPDKYQDAMVGR
ncbi:uncharacterized protein LOC133799642 [Humulus lupulus]|uniref:uncharacterized protein LOC133799642 n=1 Tax=Humulus lupulus TaxID=3486 RepID=UPI002B408BB1|nr:uncharacterized protein LOC133799642 [Humulus lupulus]